MIRAVRRLGLAAALVLGAVLVVAIPTAAAQTTPSSTPTTTCGYGPCGPSITVDHYEVHVGDVTTCTLTGFVPGETVTVSIGGVEVGTVVAAPDGSATLTCKIPKLANGVQSVTGVGSTGDHASTTIKVLAAAVAPPPKQANGPLAFTGANIWPLTLIGGLAVLLGGLLALGSRKRSLARR